MRTNHLLKNPAKTPEQLLQRAEKARKKKVLLKSTPEQCEDIAIMMKRAEGCPRKVYSLYVNKLDSELDMDRVRTA